MSNSTSKQTSDWLNNYANVTVVGLGLTGCSVVEYLLRHDVVVSVQDTRPKPPYLAAVEQLAAAKGKVIHSSLGALDKQAMLSSDLIVVSPGLSVKTPELQAARDAGVEMIGDIDMLTRSVTAPIIAITGSNGKSTVTTLVGEMCKAAGMNAFVGGNIGRPALEMLSAGEHYDVAVLELSSFQLETTKRLQATACVILNISQDHLDRYASMVDYMKAKLRIFLGAEYAVVNRNDTMLEQVLPSVKSSTTFGLGRPASDLDYGLLTDPKGIDFLAKGSRKIMPVDAVPLVGSHNIANILASIALVEPLSLPESAVVQAIGQFKGLPHRMQTVRKLNGVTWINDSKATNVGACQAAIAGIDGGVVLLAGGQGKGGDFAQLLPVLQSKVKHVILFGEDAPLLNDLWSDAVACELVSGLPEAVHKASELARQRDCVLLSPACASFDMFDSFEHRGEQFKQLVEAL